MTRIDPGNQPNEPLEPVPGRVPLFGSWRRAYAIAIGLFGVEIVLLYLFTHHFS